MSEKRDVWQVQSLARDNGDTLRAAQRLMADFVTAADQEQAFQNAMQTFINLTQPQRLQLLQTVQSHLKEGLYGCLAIDANRLIVEHVLERLEREITKADGILSKKFAHGSPEEIDRAVTLIKDIRRRVGEVTIEESKRLKISPAFEMFLATLDDRQFGAIIEFAQEMRDVKACRNYNYDAVDEDFINYSLGLGKGRNIFRKDFPKRWTFLHNQKTVIDEMAAMDFVELEILTRWLQIYRSQKSPQGNVRES